MCVCLEAQRKAPLLLPASRGGIVLYHLAQDIFYKVQIIDELWWGRWDVLHSLFDMDLFTRRNYIWEDNTGDEPGEKLQINEERYWCSQMNVTEGTCFWTLKAREERLLSINLHIYHSKPPVAPHPVRSSPRWQTDFGYFPTVTHAPRPKQEWSLSPFVKSWAISFWTHCDACFTKLPSIACSNPFSLISNQLHSYANINIPYIFRGQVESPGVYLILICHPFFKPNTRVQH